ncbi:MAG: type II secretion system protein GspC [Gammaproteobacteria bacterium]|nr:type II secretion system protein GspC [Gammaproteobacteria bacterium]
MANTLIIQLNNSLSNALVLPRFNQRLAAAASLLMIVVCVYLLVKMTWILFPQDDEAFLPVQTQNQALLNKKQAQKNAFRQLTAANIFGISVNASATNQRRAPETKLNLILKGVLAAKPMELASAIIAKGRSGKEDVFSVGDKMPGGILIKEIHAEYVVLERNGLLETLKLQKISGVGGFSGANKQRRSVSSRAATPGAALKEIRRNILKNPTSFGEYALPVVVKVKGKQIGYRLQPQKKGKLLAEIGLQPSDVITEINGVKLDNAQNGISALRKLSTAKNLNIVVKRNGADFSLNITLP